MGIIDPSGAGLGGYRNPSVIPYNYYNLGAWSPPVSAVSAPSALPVTAQSVVQELQDATYGKRMALSALGMARIGGTIMFGPFIQGGLASFGVSFGVPANPAGNRVIFDISLDGKSPAWVCPAGGTAAGDGTFVSESFTFRFYQGRLDQPVDPLETAHFPDEAIAYRPQMLMFFENLPLSRFNGRIPYVAPLIGDITDGADPTDGINLGQALELVAWSPWARYDASTFESVGVSDVVDGILLKDNFNIVELCQNITSGYPNLDLLQSDKLRIKDHGAAVDPDFVLTLDHIIDSQSPVQIVRTEPSQEPRELEVFAVDPDADYTTVSSLSQRARDPVTVSSAVGKDTLSLPVVIGANVRQALAAFGQYYKENARKKVAFSVSAYAFQIEPGDRVALIDLPDGFRDDVYKITETTHGANYRVDCRAEAILRCTAYTPGVAGPCEPPVDGIIYIDYLCPRYWVDGVDYEFGDVHSDVGTPEIVADEGLKVDGLNGSFPQGVGAVLTKIAELATSADGITVVVEWKPFEIDFGSVLTIRDTSFFEGFELSMDSGVIELITAGGVSSGSIENSEQIITENAVNRVAATFIKAPTEDGGHLAISTNGGATVTSTNDQTCSAIDVIDIGHDFTNDPDKVAGYIRKIIVYPPQDDADLPALSTVT